MAYRFDIRWRGKSPYGYRVTKTRSVHIRHRGDLPHPRACINRRLTVKRALEVIRALERKGDCLAT